MSNNSNIIKQITIIQCGHIMLLHLFICKSFTYGPHTVEMQCFGRNSSLLWLHRARMCACSLFKCEWDVSRPAPHQVAHRSTPRHSASLIETIRLCTGREMFYPRCHRPASVHVGAKVRVWPRAGEWRRFLMDSNCVISVFTSSLSSQTTVSYN